MTKLGQYEIHPLAELFPPMPDDQYQALKADIAENGQKEDIVFWQDKLVDGRHRLRACLELGVKPDMAELDDASDPYIYVISHNLHRRHLTESQRSMVAGKLATLPRGGDRKSEDFKGSIDTLKSIDDAASLLSVGRASVARAKQVIEHGSKAVVDAVESGEIPVSFAAKFVTEEPDKKTQTELVKQGKKAMKEHITEPSPFVDEKEEEKECAVKQFKAMWKKWDQVQRTAVRVWIDEHYTDV
jgi:ParB-like chromosome segregation protein Spo0J